jgi:predicted AlkP superfamily pyrophosphatase or phosphodiesterase
LKKQGINATIFQHREYTPSTYSNIMFSGATTRGYRTLAEALVNLSMMVTESQPPAYFFLYYDRVDAIGHEYGPLAPQTEAEIMTFLSAMEQVFEKSMAGNRKKILCMLTADHGHVETDPQTTVYLNREPAFAGFEKFLRKDAQGKALIPAGSPRDFFLYIEDGQVEAAQEFLAPRLEGKAIVQRVSHLIEDGYFGPKISPAFRARAGDLVILPYPGESIWWYEKDRFEQRFRGHHGGLTKQEMEIPFLCWEMM